LQDFSEVALIIHIIITMLDFEPSFLQPPPFGPVLY